MIASLKTYFWGLTLEFDSDTVKNGGHAQDFTRCRETEQSETGCRPVRWARIAALPLPESPVAGVAG